MSGSSDFLVIRCRARLSFAADAEGGLHQPLALPTQSIVFKFVDGESAGAGVVAIMECAEQASVTAGSSVDAVVTFPDAPSGEDFHDRSFALWLGRDIGTALIMAVDSE